MGQVLTPQSGQTSVTALSIPLGATATVMTGSSQFKQVGSVLARANYPDMSAAYPGRSMYYTLSQSAPNLSTNTIGTLQRMTYGATKYVAVFSNKLYYSTDGVAWTAATAPAGSYNAVVFGGTYFIATLTGAGACVRSLDGITWTAAGTLPSGSFIAYKGGTFATTSYGQSVGYYSNDNGATWTAATPSGAGGTQFSYGMTASNSYFITASLTGNRLMMSSNGTSWDGNLTAMPVSAAWTLLAANGTNVVAIDQTSNSSIAAYSTDSGVNFTQVALPTAASWQSLSYNATAGLYLAIGSTTSGAVFVTSTNGAAWTQRTFSNLPAPIAQSVSVNGVTFLQQTNVVNQLATSTTNLAFTPKVLDGLGNLFGGIAYGNGLYLAISGSAGSAGVSSNGIDWSVNALTAAAYADVTFGNGIFVAVADKSNSAAVSADGVVWSYGTLPSASKWNAITYGTKFVAIAGNIASTVAAYSNDGITWTAATLPSSQAWSDVTYGGGKYVAISGGWLAASTVAAYSNDGITWTAATLPSSQQWVSVTYGNGVFVATALGTDVYATSPDGITWTQRQMPSVQSWGDVTFGNGFFIAVAGANATSNVCATSADGINWVIRALASSAQWSMVGYGAGLFIVTSEFTGGENTVFIDNGVGSQYICITGTAGTFVRVL